MIIAAIVAYNFFTFRVQPDEVGVVLFFGKYDRDAPPGLNFRLPYPIETVYTPRVTRVNRVTIGQFADDQTSGTAGRDIPEESLMLTGDENIVDIDFSVFWVINDAADYLFSMEDPEGTVKAAAESAMREVVGRSNIQPLLTQARQITETDVLVLIQATLDKLSPACRSRRSSSSRLIRRTRSSPPSAMCRRPAPTSSASRTRPRPTPTA